MLFLIDVLVSVVCVLLFVVCCLLLHVCRLLVVVCCLLLRVCGLLLLCVIACVWLLLSCADVCSVAVMLLFVV